MTAQTDAAFDELKAEFDLLGDWEERYRYVIDLGRTLAPLSDDERSDANKVRGCASHVWITTSREADGALRFRADSDAHIVKGLIAVLNAAISMYFYLRIVVSMFMREPSEKTGLTLAPALNMALGVAIIFTMLIGIYPDPFIAMARHAVILGF